MYEGAREELWPLISWGGRKERFLSSLGEAGVFIATVCECFSWALRLTYYKKQPEHY